MGIFASLWSRLFPAKTAGDQKAEDLAGAVRVQEAEAQAAASAPTDRDSLLNALRNHDVAIVAALCLSLASCSQTIAVGCPVPRVWTPVQEDDLEANLATLPPESPLIALGVEWARLRAESKACLAVSN